MLCCARHDRVAFDLALKRHLRPLEGVKERDPSVDRASSLVEPPLRFVRPFNAGRPQIFTVMKSTPTPQIIIEKIDNDLSRSGAPGLSTRFCALGCDVVRCRVAAVQGFMRVVAASPLPKRGIKFAVLSYLYLLVVLLSTPSSSLVLNFPPSAWVAGRSGLIAGPRAGSVTSVHKGLQPIGRDTGVSVSL